MSSEKIKAVFFTVRDVENKRIFKGVAPERSLAIIKYLESRGDDLSKWLQSQVNPQATEQVESVATEQEEKSIELFKSEFEKVKDNANEFEEKYGNVIEEDSLVNGIQAATKLEDLQFIKAEFLYGNYNNLKEQEKGIWEPLSIFFNKIPDPDPSIIETKTDTKSFTEQDYNKLAEETISLNDKDNTHCDKEGDVRVKDRLGWYRKEYKDDKDPQVKYVVCGVNPWKGDTNDNHNLDWASALIDTVKSEYKSEYEIESIILVCHGRDYNGYGGKNDVVNNGDLFKKLKEKYSNLDNIIVFQHNNRVIMEALGKYNAKEVFDAIKEYSEEFYKIQKSDENGENAKAHADFGNTDGQ